MNVVAGKHKGLKLLVPQKSKTKPIMNFAKERLFNVIGCAIEDTKVLDLYAGTGSIGIEALSRGCEHVTFVEKKFSAYEVIKRNVEKCNEKENSNVVNEDTLKYLNRNMSSFDIIFSAPPYSKSYYFYFLSNMDKNANRLNEGGLIIIECNIHKRENIEMNNLIKLKEFNCDDSVFEFWIKRIK